jgi:hypothetical protein
MNSRYLCVGRNGYTEKVSQELENYGITEDSFILIKNEKEYEMNVNKNILKILSNGKSIEENLKEYLDIEIIHFFENYSKNDK